MKQTTKEQKILLWLQLHRKEFRPAPRAQEQPVAVLVPQPVPLRQREAAMELETGRTRSLEKARGILGI